MVGGSKAVGIVESLFEGSRHSRMTDSRELWGPAEWSAHPDEWAERFWPGRDDFSTDWPKAEFNEVLAPIWMDFRCLHAEWAPSGDGLCPCASCEEGAARDAANGGIGAEHARLREEYVMSFARNIAHELAHERSPSIASPLESPHAPARPVPAAQPAPSTRKRAALPPLPEEPITAQPAVQSAHKQTQMALAPLAASAVAAGNAVAVRAPHSRIC